MSQQPSYDACASDPFSASDFVLVAAVQILPTCVRLRNRFTGVKTRFDL